MGMGLGATHDIKPYDGGESEDAVGYPRPCKGRQVCRRNQEFARDIEHVVDDDDQYADRKSANSTGSFRRDADRDA